MRWDGIVIQGVIGLLLIASPHWFFRSSGDSGRDARLMRGYRAFGSTLFHLAALLALLKLVSGR